MNFVTRVAFGVTSVLRIPSNIFIFSHSAKDELFLSICLFAKMRVKLSMLLSIKTWFTTRMYIAVFWGVDFFFLVSAPLIHIIGEGTKCKYQSQFLLMICTYLFSLYLLREVKSVLISIKTWLSSQVFPDHAGQDWCPISDLLLYTINTRSQSALLSPLLSR